MLDGVQVDAVGLGGRVIVFEQGVLLQVLDDGYGGCFIVAATRESYSSVRGVRHRSETDSSQLAGCVCLVLSAVLAA